MTDTMEIELYREIAATLTYPDMTPERKAHLVGEVIAYLKNPQNKATERLTGIILTDQDRATRLQKAGRAAEWEHRERATAQVIDLIFNQGLTYDQAVIQWIRERDGETKAS